MSILIIAIAVTGLVVVATAIDSVFVIIRNVSEGKSYHCINILSVFDESIFIEKAKAVRNGYDWVFIMLHMDRSVWSLSFCCSEKHIKIVQLRKTAKKRSLAHLLNLCG
jgi:hypothetical protein